MDESMVSNLSESTAEDSPVKSSVEEEEDEEDVSEEITQVTLNEQMIVETIVRLNEPDGSTFEDIKHEISDFYEVDGEGSSDAILKFITTALKSGAVVKVEREGTDYFKLPPALSEEAVSKMVQAAIKRLKYNATYTAITEFIIKNHHIEPNVAADVVDSFLNSAVSRGEISKREIFLPNGKKVGPPNNKRPSVPTKAAARKRKSIVPTKVGESKRSRKAPAKYKAEESSPDKEEDGKKGSNKKNDAGKKITTKRGKTEDSPPPKKVPAKKGKSVSEENTSKKKPTTADMVLEALKALHATSGTSMPAIKKYIAAEFLVDVEKLGVHIRKFIKSSLESGTIVQTKGNGAAGSFKLATKNGPAKKTAAKKTAKSD